MFTLEKEQRKNINRRLVRTANLNCAEIEIEIRKLIEVEKLFCDEDLKLSRLAEILEIRADQLSELINSKYSKNYNTFLNDYRIEEAKIILTTEKNRNILAIALSCGFNSKSSFNTEFKKRTGITPREFKERFFYE